MTTTVMPSSKTGWRTIYQGITLIESQALGVGNAILPISTTSISGHSLTATCVGDTTDHPSSIVFVLNQSVSVANRTVSVVCSADPAETDIGKAKAKGAGGGSRLRGSIGFFVETDLPGGAMLISSEPDESEATRVTATTNEGHALCGTRFSFSDFSGQATIHLSPNTLSSRTTFGQFALTQLYLCTGFSF